MEYNIEGGGGGAWINRLVIVGVLVYSLTNLTSVIRGFYVCSVRSFRAVRVSDE